MLWFDILSASCYILSRGGKTCLEVDGKNTCHSASQRQLSHKRAPINNTIETQDFGMWEASEHWSRLWDGNKKIHLIRRILCSCLLYRFCTNTSSFVFHVFRYGNPPCQTPEVHVTSTIFGDPKSMFPNSFIPVVKLAPGLFIRKLLQYKRTICLICLDSIFDYLYLFYHISISYAHISRLINTQTYNGNVLENNLIRLILFRPISEHMHHSAH